MAPRKKVYLATPEDERALEVLARSEEFVRAFFQYLGLDDPSTLRYSLNCSGRNFDRTAWSNATRFTKPIAEREALRDPNAKIFQRTKAQERQLQREQEERATEIRHMRQEVSGLTEAQADERLRKVFGVYSSLTALIDGKGGMMDTICYQQLLRDCRLLNNGFSIVEADNIYSTVVLLDHSDNSKIGQYMSYEQFLQSLELVASAKFPGLVRKSGKETAIERVIRHWLLPFANMDRSKLPRAVDGLYTQSTLAVARCLDRGLKATFGFFANILMLDHKDTTWAASVETGSTLDTNEFFLLMISFRVSPQLLGKEEVLAVFREVEGETDVDESVDEMLFPAFLEVIARCALLLGQKFEQKMKKASPSEIPALKRFLSVCSPQLQEEFGGYLYERGRIFERDPETGDPKLPPPPKLEDFQATMAATMQRSEQKKAQDKTEQAMFEMQRRSTVQRSLQSRQEVNQELVHRTGLSTQPRATTSQAGNTVKSYRSKHLNTSIDDFKALTKVSLYRTPVYDMALKDDGLSMSALLDELPGGNLHGKLARPFTVPNLPSQSEARLPGIWGPNAPSVISTVDRSPLVSPFRQGTGKRGRTNSRAYSPPRRFNHESNPYPRLLDPALAAPGVKSISPPSRNPLIVPPPDHSLFLSSTAWGFAP